MWWSFYINKDSYEFNEEGLLKILWGKGLVLNLWAGTCQPFQRRSNNTLGERIWRTTKVKCSNVWFSIEHLVTLTNDIMAKNDKNLMK